jgi:hypothetical protein
LCCECCDRIGPRRVTAAAMTRLAERAASNAPAIGAGGS